MQKGIKKGAAKRPKYHGKPCRHCGGTLRYRLDRRCVHCGDARRQSKDTMMRRLYGISTAQFAEIVRLQGGKCGMCEKITDLRPDHDHKTGEIRGALCTGCNSGLGLLGDNEEGLVRALAYIRKKPKPS